MNNKYEYKLLREEVASQDAFSQKTHEHIADSIVSLIENEKGGTTIGLEGSWGSGKSTVISLMTSKLSDAKVFIFDAWAHEGDCLRRIFLESILEFFIKKLNSAELHGDIAWFQKKVETISKRKQVSTITSEKHPTGMGIILTISLFFTSIGLGLLGISNCNDSFHNWALILGFILCSIPLLVCCIYCIYLKKIQKKQIFTTKSWVFLQADSTDTIDREISEEEERSSIEFERIFTEIMEKIYEDNSDVKFVFAIDNLDRVDPQNALILWSTLQTFFQKRSLNSSETPAWFNQLWVIVPHDADGLAKIWNSAADKNTDECQNSPVTKSFLDKCFQVRFEVPAPVMTEWENFAQTCIDCACKNWSEEDRTTILDVLRFTRSDLTAVPTPRELKAYINQVCVLRASVHEKISTESICYYVLTRYINSCTKSVSYIRANLITGNYPDAQHKPYLPQNCSAEFSGLIFGVSPEIGQQILLEPEIQRALDSNDGNTLKKLSETHTDGFRYIFDYISTYRDLWKDEKTYDRFLTNCSCVVRSGIEIEKASKFLFKAKTYIGRLNKLPQDTLSVLWPATEEKVSELIDTVKLNSYNLELMRGFFKSLLEACNQKIGSEEKFVNDSLWHNLQKIVNAFPENARSAVEFSSFDMDKLLTFCQGKNDFCLAQWIKPPKEIQNGLNLFVPSGSPVRNGALETLRYIFQSDVIKEYDWNEFVTLCGNHITYNNGNVNGNSHSTLAMDLLLEIISHTATVKDKIAEFLRTPAFYRYVFNQDQENRSLKAMLLCAVVYPEQLFTRSINNNYSNEINWFNQVRDSWKNSDTEKAKEILDEASKFGLEGKVWAMGKHSQNLLFRDIVEIALSSDDYNGLFTEHDCVVLLHDYREFLKANNISDSEKKIQQLLEYLDTERGIEEYMGEKEDILLEEYANEYLYVLNTEFGTKKLREAIGAACQQLLKEQIIAILQKDSSLLELILHLHNTDNNFTMKHEFYSALQDICYVTDENAAKIEKMWSSKNGIAELLKSILPALGEYRDELVNNVTDYFCEGGTCDSDTYWQLYRPLFDIRRMDNGFLNKMAWGAVHEKQPAKLQKVADLINAKAEWKDAPEYKKIIEDALLIWYNDADDHTKQDLKFVADKFKITIPEAKSKKEKG